MKGSTNKKFIYFQLWKTATTSITRVLEPYCDTNFGFGIHHMPYHLIHQREDGREIYDNYFTFAFVRSPWDWITSEYFWARKAKDHFNHKFFNSITFEEFLDWRLKQKDRKGLQYTMLSEDATTNSPVSLDFIGKYKNLYEDLEYIKNKFNIKGQLGWEKNSNHKHYKEYFTKEMWDRTADYFQIDIEQFGYQDLVDYEKNIK